MDTDGDGHVVLEEFLGFYRSVIHDISDAEFERGYAAFLDAVKRHEAFFFNT